MIPLPTNPSLRADPIAAFVQRHQQGLWRWLRALGCEPASAEEHCQDALLAGLQNGVLLLPEIDARRWLRTAALNLYRMQLRARNRRPAVLPFEAVEAAWLAVRADRDGGDAAAAALARCLEGLPERDRELLLQRYQQGSARAAMARQFGLGEAGVKQALRRLRAKLKACMERRLRQEDGDGR